MKGFRLPKTQTKGEIMKENDNLKESLNALQSQDRFMAQQLFQVVQKLNTTNQEVQAMANLLRLEESKDEVKEGDSVMIDFVGVLSETGQLFDGSYMLGSVIKIGSKSLVEGFESSLLGMKLNETKDIEITFPEQYPEALKGKKAKFTTTVIKIWRDSSEKSIVANLYEELSKKEKKDDSKQEEKSI